MTELARTLRRIDEQVIGTNSRTRDVIDVGPFRVMFDPAVELTYLNYAIPMGAPRAEDIVRLVAAFRDHARTPRLEFRRELFPELPGLLEGAQFELEAEQPAMVCTLETFAPFRAEEVEVEFVGPDGDVEAYVRVAASAFGAPDMASPKHIEQSRASLASGAWVGALGRIDGVPAGSASLSPYRGVAELAGVGTRERFRRRGVASSVSTVLMRRFFEDGDLVWLSAGDDVARAVYERLGFAEVAHQVNYSLPS